MSPFLRPSPAEAVTHGPCISSSDILGFQCRTPPHTWTSPIQRSTFSPNLQLPCVAHLAAQPDRDMVPGAQSSPARETSLLPPSPSLPLVPPAPKCPQEAKLLSLCSLQVPTTLWPHDPSDCKSENDTLTKTQLWFHKV